MRPVTSTEMTLSPFLNVQLAPAKCARTDDAIMPSEIGRRLRRTTRLQVSGGGNDQACERSQLACAERRIAERSEADRDVRALRDEVLPLIRHGHFHTQLRVRGEEFGEPRDDFTGAVNHRQRQSDQAAKRVQAARGILGLLKSGQDFASAFQK